MQLTMASLVSELTSHGWKNERVRGYIRSLDSSLVVVADMIFIRALLICCLSVTSVRNFSCDFSLISVVSILVMFYSSPTPFSIYYIPSRSVA